MLGIPWLTGNRWDINKSEDCDRSGRDFTGERDMAVAEQGADEEEEETGIIQSDVVTVLWSANG